MPAKNALRSVQACVSQCAAGYFTRQSQPTCVQPVEKTGDRLTPQVQFLKLQVDENTHPAQQKIVDREAVELMPVNSQMADSLKFPGILLVNAHAYQMRHHVAQSVIVITLNPDDLDFAFRIGQLANVSQEFPVLFRKPPEIQVGEDIP
jgi:hypothetical protein